MINTVRDQITSQFQIIQDEGCDVENDSGAIINSISESALKYIGIKLSAQSTSNSVNHFPVRHLKSQSLQILQS